MGPSLPPHLETLLESARAGSAEALGGLFKAFRPLMCVLAHRQRELHRQLGHKVGDSDLVQDTFTTALEKFDSFRGKTPEELLAWLESILRRRSLNRAHYFRQGKRDVRVECSLDHPRAGQDAADLEDPRAESPCGRLIREEQLRLIWQAFQQLPAPYREVIQLHRRNGESFEAIADCLRLSVDAVRKRYRRGVEQWHDELARLQLRGDPA